MSSDIIVCGSCGLAWCYNCDQTMVCPDCRADNRDPPTEVDP